MKAKSALTFALAAGAVSGETLSGQTAAPLAHVKNSFQFVVAAPMSKASTLFGPEGERCWAGEHWKPEFVHPQPSRDVEGAVFTVQHGPHRSVWVNTVFDTVGGRMQYVAFISEALVFTVDVRLSVLTPSSTAVDVTYVRTALSADANEDVLSMGKRDAASGPERQRSIEECLAK
jgi:hypothetical protein